MLYTVFVTAEWRSNSSLSLSVLSQCVQPSRSPRHLAGQAAGERNSVRRVRCPWQIGGVRGVCEHWIPLRAAAETRPDNSYSACLFQVVPVSSATREVRRNRGFAVNELVFLVQAPPLGFTTYSVSLHAQGPPPASTRQRTPAAIQNRVSVTASSQTHMQKVEDLQDFIPQQAQMTEDKFYFTLFWLELFLLKNVWHFVHVQCTSGHVFKPSTVISEYFCVDLLQFLRVTFDPDTGLLSSLSNLKTKQTIKLTQNFYWSVPLWQENTQTQRQAAASPDRKSVV